MNENFNYKKTSFIFIICTLILPLYIYLYKISSNWFWIAFFLERIISPFIDKKINVFLDNDSNEDLNTNEKSLGIFLVFLIIFCIAAILLLIYILIKYPKLFILIIIGECIDKVISKIIINKK